MSDFTKSLPTEVWQIIFDKVGHINLLEQCRLVCKSWKPLVEKAIYKELNLLIVDNTQIEKLSKYLATRPDLGRLVQKITVSEISSKWPNMYKILQHTPNLKVIDGEWSKVLATIVLHRPEFSAFKFEELPCIKYDIESCLESMLCFKDTLRSAAFGFGFYGNDDYDYHDLSNTLSQFKHLQQLTIQDEFGFTSIRDLDHLLSNCNQIQHLRLTINDYDEYIHTDNAELEQWMANSVQRVETVKSLTIDYEDDSLDDEEKQPREFGPDWMYYLAYKYPNLTNVEVWSSHFQRQHLILPKAMHMDTFILEHWRFYDMDHLKQFIDTLATQSVYIKFAVNESTYYVPYICLMSAPTDYTTFSIQIAHDASIGANTASVMSLFSSRLIKKLELDLYEKEDLQTICAAMKCNLNVESFKITTDDLLLTEYPEQPIFAMLHRLEIVNASIKSDFMTQLSKYAPRSLTHLTLDNCTFEDKVSMPSTQLASLSLQNTNKEDMDYLESRSGTDLLFRISANRCPEQIILASPQKPLQRVTKGEARLLKAPTIYIECGSLKHLNVDLHGIKFEMKFDDADNLLKPVTSKIEDSYYTTLERNMKILEEDYKKMEEDHKKMEARIKLAEDRYSKSKEYLDALQIKAIEDSVPHK